MIVPRDGDPGVVMLGHGWFPQTVGGLDRYYRALLEQLPEAGGVVIGPAADAPPRVSVVMRPGSAAPLRLLAYWRAARDRGSAVDLVDAHFALYAAAPLLFGALRRRPVVFHFHGPWADENVASGDSSSLRFFLRRTLERRALRTADAFVVLSGAFRRVLVERYGISPWRVNVLAPGVPLDLFVPGDRSSARARLGLDDSAFVVVCTRRLVSRMGVDLLLDAWAELDGELPEGSTLLIVGDGPLRDELIGQADRPALLGRVRFLGSVGDEELVDVYRAADVAALPTREHEGFGMVVLEAAACGTPSLVSDVGGLPEAVHGLDPTLVVSGGDAQSWARRLHTAASGDRPARDATRHFAEGFDWPTVAARHRALYRRIIAGEHDARLRVVYVSDASRVGGTETGLLATIPHLKAVNAHVILLEDGSSVSDLQAAGISVEVLPSAGRVWRLARRLRRLKPDLVHATSSRAGRYARVAGRIARVPVRTALAGDFDAHSEDATAQIMSAYEAIVGRKPD